MDDMENEQRARICSSCEWCAGEVNSNGKNVYTDMRYTHLVGYELSLDDFGKSVFPTREEAEAALKKREETDSEH